MSDMLSVRMDPSPSGAVELLTVAEVAEALRISDTAVYRLIQSRALPHVRVGTRRYLVTREQLNAYIDDCSVPILRASTDRDS